MTLQEMAAEYRRTGAQLAAAIKARENNPDAREELRILRQELEENRQIRRCLAGYYAHPRDPAITLVDCRGRAPDRDDG